MDRTAIITEMENIVDEYNRVPDPYYTLGRFLGLYDAILADEGGSNEPSS